MGSTMRSERREIPSLIPFTDWESNAHSLTVQRGQNAHYVPSL